MIWTLNKAKLYRYVPVLPKEKLHPVPLLLVFALMNRPYILDLRPGHSFVEFMLKHGYDVYLLDWGAPGIEDKNLKFDDYTPRIHAARDPQDEGGLRIRRVQPARLVHRRHSDHDLCGPAARRWTAQPDSSHRAAGFLATKRTSPSRAGSTRRYFDVDKVLATFGNMPPEMIEYGAKALKPVENYIGNYLRLWDNLDNPQVIDAWHAMNTWVTDNIPLAGGAFRQLIVDLYRNNRLMKGP